MDYVFKKCFFFKKWIIKEKSGIENWRICMYRLKHNTNSNTKTVKFTNDKPI